MKPATDALSAQQLRQLFDEGFTRLPSGAGEPEEALLAIRSAGKGQVLRLSEISGLVRCGTIVAVPGAAGSLLGITGLKGAIVPVFGLAGLLGLGAEQQGVSWLALCGAEPRIGLAFSEFEYFFTAKRSDISAGDAAPGASAPEIVRHAGKLRPLISLGTLLKPIQRPSSNGGPAVEIR